MPFGLIYTNVRQCHSLVIPGEAIFPQLGFEDFGDLCKNYKVMNVGRNRGNIGVLIAIAFVAVEELLR